MEGDIYRIGIVGLDTSHSEHFAEILTNEPETTVEGIWDGGDVRSKSYVSEFCRSNDAERYEQPEALADDVDAAMVLTVNWDQHRPMAETFLRAGVPTFVDKPLAGSVADVDAIRTVAHETDTPLFGGSAVPFHPSIDDMRADDGPHDLFTAGYNDPFYYGVHLTDTARRICGSDWELVEPTPHRNTVTVTFAGRSGATLRLDGPTEDAAFGILDVGSVVRTARIGSSERELQRMYDPFLNAFLEAVKGEWDDTDTLCDAATLLLAVQAAMAAQEPIEPDSPSLYEFHEDGDSFVDGYEPLY